MKERTKENKREWDAKKELMIMSESHSVRRKKIKLNENASAFLDYEINMGMLNLLEKNWSGVACQCACISSTKKNVRVVCAP